MRLIDRGHCKTAILVAAGLMMILVLGSCASRPDTPIYNIRTDKSFDGQETVGIIELKMIDKTFSLESYMPIFVADRRYPLYFVDQNLQPLEWMMWHYWKTHGQANYFEAVCLFKAQPGFYGLSNLVLEKQSASSFDGSHQVNVHVDKKWRIPAQRLVYLGQLHVEFTKRRIASDGRGSYQHHVEFNHEAKNLPRVLNYFKHEYPKLYTQYIKQLQIVEPLP